MVIIEQGEDAICVGQAAHAWISGQLARRWLPRPEPFEAVCLAAEQHDVGMAEWDLQPTLDAETGHPTHFMRMPRETHLALWTAAPRKLLSQSPYAALLVSMHGHALYGRSEAPEPAVRRYLAAQEDLQRGLLEALDEEPARARRNQRLLWALDFLSLGLLLGWAPASVDDIAIEPAGEHRVTVDPWPFDAETIEVSTSARHLKGRHADEPSLHRALERAPWVTLSYELARR